MVRCAAPYEILKARARWHVGTRRGTATYKIEVCYKQVTFKLF